MQLGRNISIRALLFLTLILQGCASFEPGFRLQDLSRPRQPTAREIRDGLEVSVEEFASASKSLQVFDADLSPNGVFSLLIRIENNSTQNYTIKEKDVRVLLHEVSLEQLIGGEASERAASSQYAGKALFWTVAAGPFAVLLWPSTIAASATHTHAVNRRIRQHFEALEFTDALIKPGQIAAGFVYFAIPNGSGNLANMTVIVEPVAENSEQRLLYSFALPTIELSKPVPKERTVGASQER